MLSCGFAFSLLVDSKEVVVVAVAIETMPTRRSTTTTDVIVDGVGDVGLRD